MVVSLTRLSRWLWRGKEKDSASNGSSLNSSTDRRSGFRELNSVKYPARNLASAREAKREWHSRKDSRLDKQYGDAVRVPSVESNDPDWSIGWMEPHGPGFRSDGETDDGFAVLVPCYRLDSKELAENSTNLLLNAMKNLPNEFSSEGKNYKEWFSSFRASKV